MMTKKEVAKFIERSERAVSQAIRNIENRTAGQFGLKSRDGMRYRDFEIDKIAAEFGVMVLMPDGK